MYMSTLLIDVGLNPDRPRPGRLWLRNLYRVHQRLCMAFPSAFRLEDDSNFLKPFKPEDFGGKQVHVPRRRDAGFLFRVDPQPGGRVVILVQSALEPNWNYAFQNADYLLAASPEVKTFTPSFKIEQHLRFRLSANPTRKVGTKSGPNGKKQNGRRVPVPPDRFVSWLDRKAGMAGFFVDPEKVTVQPGWIYESKEIHKVGNRLRSVRYDGILRVTDPVLFQETLARGIGPGKAFGFGLLSVAPA